ncbi:caspase family protein [Larkinella sp. C7]|jgi:hypothetical protein|uniref:caspase family protein n=1 Tax=Larkinella sp. C7 TaxID=2576607 RepID=UPI00111151A3|nr:caspase family protein [Larkinella sp. C7]
MKNTLPYLLLFLICSGTGMAQQPPTVSAQSGWVKITKPPAVAPRITWRTPLARRVSESKPVYRLSVCIESAEPVTKLLFFHNDKEINGLQRGIIKVACGTEYAEEIQLVSGANAVYVVATNVAGTTTSETRLIINQPEKTEIAVKSAAPKRLALIIANGKYPKYPLKNPANDGKAVKTQLENLGFAVTYKENLPLRELKTSFDTFLAELGNHNIGLFYYAGHGLMVNGENYVQPVDADPTAEPDVEFECYPLRRLVARMADTNPKGSNVIFWDACRNNPYRSWHRGAGEPSFAPVQPAVGTLIIYATEPGKVAHDGNEENGLFTSELVKHIGQPNVDIFEMIDRIDRGLEERGFKQPTYIEGRLRGKFFFKMP